MALRIGVPKETTPGERRVALIPDVVARLAKKNIEVVVETGAGAGAYHADSEYAQHGAHIGSRADAFGADVVAKVQRPNEEEIALLRSGSVLIGFLSPLDHPGTSASLAKQGVTALSMELVPRISRAQKMDALSAMSSVAGYRAVLVGAEMLPKFFPLLTTAAGTVKPANVLVLGAGVAGLQAIATARRLGGRVAAYDVREAVKEEVQSLGATFIELEFETQEDRETGGYARALSEEKQRRQVELLVPHIGKADVVICTALVPGRDAPLLVSEDAVRALAPGSVIVDLAAPNGGNCALTEPGKTTTVHGVRILGPLNLAAEMPIHASQMYSRTMLAMIEEGFKEDRFATDFEDEVFRGSCVTFEGAVVNERVKALLEPAA